MGIAANTVSLADLSRALRDRSNVSLNFRDDTSADVMVAPAMGRPVKVGALFLLATGKVEYRSKYSKRIKGRGDTWEDVDLGERGFETQAGAIDHMLRALVQAFEKGGRQ